MSINPFVGHCAPVSNCCGISLRNGVMWIGEICSVVGFALFIFSVCAIDEVLAHWHWRYSDGYLFASLHSIALLLGAIQFATSVTLVVGVLKEKPVLLQPWIIFYTVQTGLLLLATIICAILIIIYIEPLPVGITLFLVSITYVYGFRYFILVVHSYYRQLMVVTPGGNTAAGVMQLA